MNGDKGRNEMTTKRTMRRRKKRRNNEPTAVVWSKDRCEDGSIGSAPMQQRLVRVSPFSSKDE
jgi:hypothetical protein